MQKKKHKNENEELLDSEILINTDDHKRIWS